MNLFLISRGATIKKFLPRKMLLVMRLTAIFLLSAALHVSAAGFSQKVTISKKNVTIEEVFNVLQQQTGYSFVFNSHALDKAKRVDIEVIGASVEEVLELCFKDQPLTYVIRDKVIIVKEKDEKKVDELNALSLPLPPPQHITGTVRDDNNKPLEGASVIVKKIGAGTQTDKQGRFELNVSTGTTELEISFVIFSIKSSLEISPDIMVNCD